MDKIAYDIGIFFYNAFKLIGVGSAWSTEETIVVGYSFMLFLVAVIAYTYTKDK